MLTADWPKTYVLINGAMIFGVTCSIAAKYIGLVPIILDVPYRMLQTWN